MKRVRHVGISCCGGPDAAPCDSGQPTCRIWDTPQACDRVAFERNVCRVIDRSVLSRMDLPDAVQRELILRNRLLPSRWDYLALATEHASVEEALRPLIRRGPSGAVANVVLSDKGWRGVRPLHLMALSDRVLYRALVELTGAALPEHLRHRSLLRSFGRRRWTYRAASRSTRG